MRETLQNFLSRSHDGVYYIGHSSALVRINNELFMFDPIWDHKPYGDYWNFYPSQVNCDEILKDVKGVFISHIHEDHVCMPILKRLPKGCWIRTMEGRPNLKERILQTGAVGEDYSPLVWHEIKQGIEIMFVPHAFNSIDSSVFIRSKDYCVYVGSDNFLDEKCLEQIKGIDIDVALLPYAFIHWYPRMMNMDYLEIKQEIKRLNFQSIEQAVDFIRVMKPKHVIPFGNNLVYCDENSILNKWICKAEDLIKSPIETGGYVLSNGEFTLDFHNEKFPHKALPELDFNVVLEPFMIEEIRDRVKRAQKKVFNHELIINGLVIDLETLEVKVRFHDDDKPCTRFDFDKEVFQDWAVGHITFEQAIGTRRFKCLRTPNEYNLQVFEFMNNYL